MAKIAFPTETLLTAINMVRPVKYKSADGLMSKLWVKDGYMFSYYKNVMLRFPVIGLFDFQVDADSFCKAIRAAKSKEITLNITDANNLTLSAGRLRTRMSTTSDILPEYEVIDNWYQSHGELLPTIKKLAKWVPQEARQLFATTLLLRNGFAYASDGVYIIKEKLLVDFEFECALTSPIIDVLDKLKLEPHSLSFSRGKMYFGFSTGLSMQAPTLAEKWPNIDPFFSASYNMLPISKELLETLDQLSVYDEGEAMLEYWGDKKAVSHLPSKLMPKTTVEVVFDEPPAPSNFNVKIKEMTKLSKGMELMCVTERFICMSGGDTVVILAQQR